MKKKMLIVLLVLVFSLTLAMPTPALSQSDYPFHVKPTPVGNADGSDWDNACSLQYALTNASSGDEIWVAEGIYKPGTDRSDTFQLKSNVAVYGGFAGTETERGQRDWVANLTILSGDIGSPVWPYDNSYHVVMVEGKKAAILDGLYINSGMTWDKEHQNEDTPHNWGAGIYNNGTLTVNNCILSDNSAYWRGGGIYNSGTLTVKNCIIN